MCTTHLCPSLITICLTCFLPFFLIASFPLQVSVEPDGSSYVFQGFIQGKDYGQFGLQRLGNSLPGLVTAPNNKCVP